jgi:hypothetical protein
MVITSTFVAQWIAPPRSLGERRRNSTSFVDRAACHRDGGA